MSREPESKTSHIKFRLRLTSIGILLTAGVIVGLGTYVRTTQNRQLVAWTEERAVPAVRVATPIRSTQETVIRLPGRLEAFSRASIYSRVDGYLKSWAVEIGDSVTAGQILATIETPELDQQLLQARADLSSTTVSATLASASAKRWLALGQSNAVSQQQVDEHVAEAGTTQARVNAAKANVDRLIETKRFAQIVAPFDGMVTTRATDVGALIEAGRGTGNGQPLFEVADVKKLRLYVQVPQNYTSAIGAGTEAKLTLPEHPGQLFTAKVMAASGAIDSASNSMRVQLVVDNPERELLAGAYVDMSFYVPADSNRLKVPASAVVFDSSGVRVATIDGANRVSFKTITIANDTGSYIDVQDGLLPSDRVIQSPPDGLQDGDTVRLSTAEKTAAPNA